METTAHFENIPQEIARRLTAATQEIVVAVAWFTDRDLFDVLCRQAGLGLRVRLAVLGDRINIGPGKLNFQRLQDCGGAVFLIPAGGDRDPIMHHKFCIIDRATVIIGVRRKGRDRAGGRQRPRRLRGLPRPPPQRPPDDLKKLKRLYQQASQKCHPDKVGEADRAGTARWKREAIATTIGPGVTDPWQTSRSSA